MAETFPLIACWQNNNIRGALRSGMKEAALVECNADPESFSPYDMAG
jgi:hypothetical protein